MKKIFVIAYILLANSLLAQDSTKIKLEELLNAYAKLNRLNGSVLVAKQGVVILQKGYGIKNSVEGSLNDADTKFQIASVTKQFTAAVILKLVELNKMSLNDKLSKYYPGFINGDSISIENLLTHTSGMRNFTEEDSSIQKTNEALMVAYLKTLKPDFAPGSSWHYSNSGYVMLGFIIQKVCGTSYWQAVHQYIFDKLQMRHSSFDFANAPGNKATGYDELDDSVQKRASITDSTAPFAAGAIYSTVKDMYQWHRGLQQYKIVNKILMDKAYTPCAKNNYGYGWQIDSMFGRRVLSHSGAISGFASNFARIPEDDICIVLLSNKSGTTEELMHITEKLLAVLYKQPYSIPVKRKAIAVSETELQQYTGTYEIADMQLVIEMSINSGSFIAQPSRGGHAGPASVLLCTGGKHFYDERDEDVGIIFDTDTEGKVKGVTIVQMGIKRYARKIK